MIQFGLGLIVLLVILVVMSLKILREYERAVVFFLGRFQRVFGPGLIVIIPGVQQFVRVHRTHIINLSHIVAFRRIGGGRLAAELLDGTRLPVSRNRAQVIRNLGF